MRYATTTDLLPHQQDAIAKLLPARVGALFADMGTGKTLAALELARARDAKWDRLIWCCPVSAKETIRQEILTHTTLTPDQVYVFGERTRAASIPLDRVVYIVGIESLSQSMRITSALDTLITERGFVICDESSYIKGHLARRTQRLTNLAARCRYRLLLTGTPITQGVIDLFAQMRFLSPAILGYTSFWSFAANHLEYEIAPNARGIRQRTGRILRAHNESYLAAKMQPYVYQVRKDECLTLPTKLYETRYCRMTTAQAQLYQRAKNEFLRDDLANWEAIDLYKLFTALQTISCGWWERRLPDTPGQITPQDEQHETLSVAHNRIDLLLATLAEIPPTEKVVIWGKYQRAIAEIVAALSQVYGSESVAQFHGGQRMKARNADLARWRLPADQGGARFLVATQSAGSHALTLTEAAYAVFYADSFKCAERLQAEDRLHRIGQSRRPVYLSLLCDNTIDRRIHDALARKESLLRIFQRRIDECRRQGLRAQAEALIRSL